MDAKSIHILEYPKVLERLSNYCAFSVSSEKALWLMPSSDIFEARLRQAETSEAVRLLSTHPDLTIGGARDVRASVDLALHGGVLAPNELLDVKYTLVAARNLARNFERLAIQFPKLSDIVTQLPPPLGIIDAVSHAISERGEILDSASEKLGVVRRELRIVHDRLMSKLQKMVSDPKNTPFLQEALVTQRDGRYVLPLRAEFKGRIRSIVHDQSASGATLFVEPVGTVEMNNQYRELELAERDEIHRILTALSNQIGQYAYEINHTVEVIAELDLVLARARYAEELHSTEPILHPISRKPGEDTPPILSDADHPSGSGVHEASNAVRNAEISQPRNRMPGTIIRLYQARHPLINPETVVPIDLELDDRTYALVVTGPNTGGKTVTLKTVGLLALMAQSGLHIPVQSGSEISVFDEIYADIGDEQSIEQSLSTFSGHITNIIHILEHADPRSLVILDELGAGTDPQEGSALARAILSHLLDRGITTLVTTHHPELKAFAHATPGVTNACVEFNLETLQPTFHLSIGLPGRSNAIAIAERLGLPESIIDAARLEINPDDLRSDDLLDEILRQRDLARQSRSAAENSRKEAEALQISLIERLEKIEDERRKILEETRQESTERLEILEQELSLVRKSLIRARQPLDTLKEVQEKVEELQEEAEKPITRILNEIPGKGRRLHRAIRLGDRVRLRNLGAQGIVTSLSHDEAEVQVGVLRVRAHLSELELPTPSGASPESDDRSTVTLSLQSASSEEGSRTTVSESPGIELDLRGKRAEEALDELEHYLDSAFISGLPFVRIIHGKGTGKLREVVRQALIHHPQILSFEPGGDSEGGEGVTVIKLATN